MNHGLAIKVLEVEIEELVDEEAMLVRSYDSKQREMEDNVYHGRQRLLEDSLDIISSMLEFTRGELTELRDSLQYLQEASK